MEPSLVRLALAVPLVILLSRRLVSGAAPAEETGRRLPGGVLVSERTP
jgi:hypothetical protein